MKNLIQIIIVIIIFKINTINCGFIINKDHCNCKNSIFTYPIQLIIDSFQFPFQLPPLPPPPPQSLQSLKKKKEKPLFIKKKKEKPLFIEKKKNNNNNNNNKKLPRIKNSSLNLCTSPLNQLVIINITFVNNNEIYPVDLYFDALLLLINQTTNNNLLHNLCAVIHIDGTVPEVIEIYDLNQVYIYMGSYPSSFTLYFEQKELIYEENIYYPFEYRFDSYKNNINKIHGSETLCDC